VYARQIGGQVLTFGVSGMLFRDGLVMFDRQTDSLWTQVDGRAIRGRFAGRELEIVPSIHATWKQWRTLYPDSVALQKPGPLRSAYGDYNRDPSRLGVRGRRLSDRRLPAKERVIGVRSADGVTAFVEQDVRRARLVEANVGSLPVVLAAPGGDLPVVAFERRHDGRVLSFRLDDDDAGVLVDRGTGSRWSIAYGEALEGPLKGAVLRRAKAYPAFWFGWHGYFPLTGIWRRDE
jgi:hypothetical protein